MLEAFNALSVGEFALLAFAFLCSLVALVQLGALLLRGGAISILYPILATVLWVVFFWVTR